MERPKMGFAIPLEGWLLNELNPLVHDYLSVEKLKAHGIFNEKEVTKLCNDFFNGRREKYLKIWHLLMFQMWYDKWMK
jgi:asparagine synthase (glutamine-hydrolysing)